MANSYKTLLTIIFSVDWGISEANFSVVKQNDALVFEACVLYFFES